MQDAHQAKPIQSSQIGANEQYELLFASYLNSLDAARQLGNETATLIETVRSGAEQLGQPISAKSRFPLGFLVHRIFGRLLQRHLRPQTDEIRAQMLHIATLLELVVKTWEEQYSHEFTLERQLRRGLSERIASLDSIIIRVDELEQQILDLNSSHQ